MVNSCFGTVGIAVLALFTLAKNFLISFSVKCLGYAFLRNMDFRFNISFCKSSLEEQIVNKRNNNVETKLSLYRSGMKLQKFVYTPLNVGF